MLTEKEKAEAERLYNILMVRNSEEQQEEAIDALFTIDIKRYSKISHAWKLSVELKTISKLMQSAERYRLQLEEKFDRVKKSWCERCGAELQFHGEENDTLEKPKISGLCGAYSAVTGKETHLCSRCMNEFATFMNKWKQQNRRNVSVDQDELLKTFLYVSELHGVQSHSDRHS